MFCIALRKRQSVASRSDPAQHQKWFPQTLVVMLSAVYRTHNSQEYDQGVCGDYGQQRGKI
jgi:hypothetical protein